MKYIRPKERDIPIKYVVVEDSLQEPWLNLIRQTDGDEMINNLIIEDTDKYFLDAGGMIGTEEKKIEVEVGGCKFTVLMRFIEDFIPFLRRMSTSKNNVMGDHVFIPGFMVHLILTPNTANEFADRLEAEKVVGNDDIEDAWNSYNNFIEKTNEGGMKILPRERRNKP